jgi:phenylacetate-CoA ligase
MHINVDHVIVEFLDANGRPVTAGETGYVVVTDLINDVMPLIRYRVEDLAAPIEGPCACGRGLPLMGRVAGRTADFLVRADGSRVAGVSLIENSLTRIDGIEQMQIVQDDIDRITLRVVPDVEFEPARSELQRYFESAFPGTTIAIELVPAIAREANGKHRFAICNVAS